MEYFDEELLEAKREQERKRYTTLETGIYVGDELITFTQVTLPESKIQLLLPEQFVIMPEIVKDAKYPSKYAPDFIMTSLDRMVNFGFSLLSVQDADVKAMSKQFQNALHNINPSIMVKNQTDTKTEQGNEMSWFDYKGFLLDGQSYNRVYLLRMRKIVLHGIFNCQLRDKKEWESIVDKVFMKLEEDV